MSNSAKGSHSYPKPHVFKCHSYSIFSLLNDQTYSDQIVCADLVVIVEVDDGLVVRHSSDVEVWS